MTTQRHLRPLFLATCLTSLGSLATVSLAASLPGDDADWPRWRGPERTGVSNEAGWRPEGAAAPLWEAEVGLGYSSVVVADGKLVVLDDLAVKEPKTGALEKQLAGKLKLADKTLLVPLAEEPNLDLAARNNPRLNVVRALGVSVVDLMDCDTVVMSEPAVKRLCEVLAP